MDREQYDTLPVGTEFTVRSACPGCGERNVVEGTIKMLPDKPRGSLAGGQMKIAVHRSAWMTCTECGWQGEGMPK